MHPIIQAEVDEFEKMIHGHHGHKDTLVHEDEFFYNIESMKSFLSAALHRAVESAGKEMVGNPRKLLGSVEKNDIWREGYNECRSLALSKLDIIINFKE